MTASVADRPRSYGDVTGEYLALRRATGVVEWHDIVWVRGPDTIAFLEGLLSQSLEPLDAGAVAPSLLLSPQGKLRVPHWVLRGEGEVGLIADRGCGETAIEDLKRFKIRVDAELELESSQVLDLWGPTAADTLRALDLPVPTGWVRTVEDQVVAAVPFRGGGGLPRFVVTGVTPGAIVTAGGVMAGGNAADAVRIEQGEPVTGIDINDKTIPAEAHLVDGAVDFDKGCYLGQELVARIDSRGRVNRQLRGVLVTTNVMPPVGAELVVDEKVVGSVTSFAESLDLRAPIGLALVRREVEPGSDVTLRWDSGSTTAHIEELPMIADAIQAG